MSDFDWLATRAEFPTLDRWTCLHEARKKIAPQGQERAVAACYRDVQAAGVIATPLPDLRADMIAIGGHKALLGLTGSGVRFRRAKVVDAIRTPFFKPPAQAGSAAAQFLSGIGLSDIEQRLRHLGDS